MLLKEFPFFGNSFFFIIFGTKCAQISQNSLRMKRILVALVLMVSFVSIAQDPPSSLEWYTSLEQAEKVSKSSNKPILVYFTGSDWCPPCIALKADFFESDEFLSRADSFVLVMIDYPRRVDIISEEQMVYNKGIIAKYNKDKSFPKVLMLNENGSELGKLSGYSSYNTYKDISHHVKFVDRFSAKNP